MAERVDAVLALYGYEMAPAIDAIDDAVDGHGGLFGPDTTDGEIRAAIEDVLAGGPPESTAGAEAAGREVVLYVDGSSRGNPGPAGAGAVIIVDETTVATLGRPVGTRADNNIAEYAALQLGLDALAPHDPASVEVRIDSMTVVDAIWGEEGEPIEPYGAAISDHLSALSAHEWTHLVDSDPNPADARATVGADIAALGPG
nr:ribonuclease HI family protein [Halovenus carboxidivorans]